MLLTFVALGLESKGSDAREIVVGLTAFALASDGLVRTGSVVRAAGALTSGIEAAR